MPARPGERITALAYFLQPDVPPALGLATDRHLLSTLGRSPRGRGGVLRVYSFPGDVLAAGRWHLVAPATAGDGASFVRRLSGGRALALGEGYAGVSLLLPHRSALLADDPLALAPFQVPNRYVRALLRALKGFGVAAFYPGRDLVTVNRRPIAAVAFETDATGKLAFEMIVAVERPLGAVAQLLDRWDVGGVIKADLLALDAGTCLREEIGEAVSLGDFGAALREAFAEQFAVSVTDDVLSPLEEQAVAGLASRETQTWNTARQPRPDLPLTGSCGIQTGVLEVHFALEQRRFIKDVMIAGDFIANSPAVSALEYRLRLCPAERAAIGRVVDSVFSDPANYLLGVGPLRTVADTLVKGLPS